ncbi:MAG: phosphate signaling complex protein PhoU [Deltaproteobacteria bacterium]|nr:phosphate signaling complex protein PhoU [Deltaproteobacteria bacterium]
MPGRSHTDREYEAKLGELREALLKMAGSVETMIDESIEALVERDADKARKVIRDDGPVNRQEMEIDELCLLVLARWQPMASDLRFMALALKMVTDLERIGDLAVNIAERAEDLAGKPPPPQPYIDIPRMAELARGMVHDAIDAFVEKDPEKARAVLGRDDEVDHLYEKVFKDILDIMRSRPDWMHEGIHIQSIAKWLERVGDHATNLAEEVIFCLLGRDVRHSGHLPDKR